MERLCKRKKTKKRENFEERSPLQHLNGLLPIHKRNTTKCSDLSSSSAPAASRFLLSDNPCSSSSFSPSSRTQVDKKPKTFSKIATNEPNKSRLHTSNVVLRSKENEIPIKSFLQTSGKEKPQFIPQRQNWQSDAKPTCRNRQRSKLSSVQSKSENKMMKGSREFQENMKNSVEIDSGKCAFELNRVSNGSNSNCAENCTPMSGNGSHSLSFCDHEFAIEEDSIYERANANANANAATDVKTPPVEASLSPEIQCHSQSKMLVLKSVGTPVCYGAGHLVSGVSDKRKYRRRGSLRGGPEKAILFLDARRDENENVSVDLQESSIPLLAEASVRWHLSPCNVGREDLRIGLDQGRMMVCDDDSGTFDLLSSPSMLCGNTSDFLCAKSSYSGSGNVGNVVINRSSMDESLLATSPNATYSCNDISSTEGRRDNSILSDVSLNSGNIIQTPDSDSSSDACFRRSRLEEHLSNSVWPELDPITKTLERMKLSPRTRSEISMWDAPVLGTGSPPIYHDPTQLQKNVDSVSSWVSDTTAIDNLTLSQMRISWCEGLASKIVGTDEFDCCCRLSDEEIDGDEQLKLYPLTDAAEEKETYHCNNSGQRNYLDVASVENKENGFRIGNEFSPVHLDYEPCLHGGGKGKSSSHDRPNAGVESICTDGGGLVASDDSDWTYFQESRLFHVT